MTSIEDQKIRRRLTDPLFSRTIRDTVKHSEENSDTPTHSETESNFSQSEQDNEKNTSQSDQENSVSDETDSDFSEKETDHNDLVIQNFLDSLDNTNKNEKSIYLVEIDKDFKFFCETKQELQNTIDQYIHSIKRIQNNHYFSVLCKNNTIKVYSVYKFFVINYPYLETTISISKIYKGL